MKKFITILLLFVGMSLHATNYYVKIGGNDGAAGTSDGTAWATIGRVNTVWAAGTFAAGDSILFRRGDTWYGSITVSESGTAGSPIAIGAYGTGDLPIIEGFATPSSWTVYSGNISYATLTAQSATEMVTIDGTQFAKGRYPNDGTWLTITVRNSTTQVTVAGLTGTPSWVGAEMVCKENRWHISRHPITNHAPEDVLTFTSALTYNPVGYGLFIQGALATLDVAGEWYHDHAANRLYMHTSHTSTIRASALNYGVNVGSYQFIVVSNLHLRGFNVGAVYADYGNYDTHGLKVDGCTISHSGKHAVFINRSSADTVVNSTISYSNHSAVTMWGNYGNYNYVGGNTISRTGEIYGAAGNLVGTSWANDAYDAVYINPNNSTVENNSITYTGYLPINYRGTNALIQNNYIDTYCYVKDDGGGIYVFSDQTLNKRVLDNIVLNAIGAQQGVVTASTSAHGLYTDGGSSNVYYEGNIVGNMIGAGYHGNMPQNIVVTNNKFFECGKFIDLWKHDVGTYINNLRITNNHFVSSRILEELPAMIKYHNSTGDYYTGGMDAEVTHFGEIDSNYYHINSETAVYILNDISAAPRSLARWSTEYGHDDHSSINIMNPYTINRLSANLLTNGTFDADITGWTATSPASISWNNGELGSGGCAQLSSTQVNYDWYWWQNANMITTAISGGAISADSVYVLQLDGKSAINNKTLNLKLYQTGTNSPKQRFFTVGTTEQTKQVVFVDPATVSSGATLRLVLADDPVTTYVDNVSFHTAGVTIRDWASTLHLIYNETNANKTFYMSQAMTDPEGTVRNSVTLAPQGGMILLGAGTISESGTPSPSGFGKVGTKFGKYGNKFAKISESP